MATPQSPKPIYNNPGRPRRDSCRPMGASLSRSSSYLNAARVAAPKDGDAFSYNPAHLRHWYCPQELWDRLPEQVQSSLAALQHAGAAVLTGTFSLSPVPFFNHVSSFCPSRASLPRSDINSVQVSSDSTSTWRAPTTVMSTANLPLTTRWLSSISFHRQGFAQ